MKEAICILVLLITCACSNEKVSGSRDYPSNKNNLSQLKLDSFKHKLDSLYKIDVFNGFAVSIVDENGEIYNEGFGYADVENHRKYDQNTLINIASISKMFIGFSLMKAVELGHLKLDDPINKYLSFEVKNPSYPEADITIRQLATHTSSIADNDSYMEHSYLNKDDIMIAEELMEKYEFYYANPSTGSMILPDFLHKILIEGSEWYDDSIFSESEPGADYDYSNIGATLCALVIENAVKQPFHEFSKEHIFSPLDMVSTAWFFEEINMLRYSKLYYDESELPYYKSLSYPDGSLITSSTDLSKFLSELIKGHLGKGELLQASSYEELFKSQLEEDQFGGKIGFNVGLFTEKELPYHVIGHTGGDPGTNTMMFFDTEKNIGRIMILNTDSKKENSDDVFWGIWTALDELI